MVAREFFQQLLSIIHYCNGGYIRWHEKVETFFKFMREVIAHQRQAGRKEEIGLPSGPSASAIAFSQKRHCDGVPSQGLMTRSALAASFRNHAS